MTHEGAKSLLRVMMAAYPTFKPGDIRETLAVWENLLKAYDDRQAALALEAYIASTPSGFAPSIGQLIELIKANPDELGELEAWALVNRAIRNSTYNAESEFSKLPEAVRLAIGDPGQLRQWAMTDLDDIQTVIASNFQRAYRSTLERMRKADRMPPEVARLFQREAPMPELPEKEPAWEEAEGVPMPEELRQALRRKLAE